MTYVKKDLEIWIQVEWNPMRYCPICKHSIINHTGSYVVEKDAYAGVTRCLV